MYIINGSPVGLETLDDTKRHALLRDATEILCGCQGIGGSAKMQLPMHKRHRDSRILLAKNPHTGPKHARSCRHFELNVESLAKLGYAEGAIKIDENDESILELSVSLTNSKSVRLQPSSPFTIAGTTRARHVLPQVTPLGLLHFLWERASLHRHVPGEPVTAAEVMHRLRDAARSTRLARAHSTRFGIEEFLLIQGASKGIEKVITSNYSKLKQAYERSKKVLCIAMFKGPSDTAFVAVDKRGHATLYPVLNAAISSDTSPSLRALLTGHFDAALSAYDLGATLVTLAVARTGKHGATIEDVVAMPVTKAWIPFESSYERALAESLVADGRCFEKPLRYDNVESVFPDFVLEDCAHGRHVLEVYGVAGRPAYESRLKAKREIYARDYQGSYWEWAAVDEPDLSAWLAANPLPPIGS